MLCCVAATPTQLKIIIISVEDCARNTVIKMEYRVNFLVDGLYSITIWRKNVEY